MSKKLIFNISDWADPPERTTQKILVSQSLALADLATN
jgi:hypothetical protein